MAVYEPRDPIPDHDRALDLSSGVFSAIRELRKPGSEARRVHGNRYRSDAFVHPGLVLIAVTMLPLKARASPPLQQHLHRHFRRLHRNVMTGLDNIELRPRYLASDRSHMRRRPELIVSACHDQGRTAYLGEIRR